MSFANLNEILYPTTTTAATSQPAVSDINSYFNFSPSNRYRGATQVSGHGVQMDYAPDSLQARAMQLSNGQYSGLAYPELQSGQHWVGSNNFWSDQYWLNKAAGMDDSTIFNKLGQYGWNGASHNIPGFRAADGSSITANDGAVARGRDAAGFGKMDQNYNRFGSETLNQMLGQTTDPAEQSAIQGQITSRETRTPTSGTQAQQGNPYLNQMAGAITQQVNDNLTRNILPQISSGAQLAGGFGGSRQGVVEANALKDANQGLSNSLASMYYGDYNNDQNRQLQRYGMDQSYNLGMFNANNNFALGRGQLQLGNLNANNNFALGMGQLQLGNRNTDLNQVQVGANLFQNGNTGFMGGGQGTYNLGLTQQQAPWQVSGNFNNTMTPYTGLGATNSSTSGNPVAGALGGAVAGSQLYNLWNQGNTSTPSNIYNSGNNGGYNVSNGFAFDNSGMML